MNKRSFVLLCVLVASLVIASSASAAPVEYVKICSVYGAEFLYLPGTDVCWNSHTGDARMATAGGVWRTLLPYPEGKWAQQFRLGCEGKIIKVGDFRSTDFKLNPWERKETAPFPLELPTGQFITQVIMSGGFYDPRIRSQGGSNGTLGLCLRGKDPTVFIPNPSNGRPENPPFGNGLLPIGCVANSRILNMPLPYVISATAAYPQTYSFFPTADQTVVSGPYTYGRQLVMTTDIGPGGQRLLTYRDATANVDRPLAGTVSVHVCIGGDGYGR